MELIGQRAAPKETFAELKEAVKGVRFDQATVMLITDWQDQRVSARFAVYVREGKHKVLTFDAFGPKFGKEGDNTLRELVRWFLDHGVDTDSFREAVIAPSEYSALFELSEGQANQILSANASPCDPSIYIKRGFTSRM